MKQFKTENELVEWIETMHLQNTSGRETENEMFRLGIEAAIEELADLKLFSLASVIKSEAAVCKTCNGLKGWYDEDGYVKCPRCCK